MAYFPDDAQDVEADVLDPIGGQTFVDEFAHVEVFADPADAEEGRIVLADVLLVGIAQRFELLSEGVVDFEPDEDRLIDQKFKHLYSPRLNGRPRRDPGPILGGRYGRVDP